MKYAIIECVNGNYFGCPGGRYEEMERITDLAAAKTQFHSRCQALWNEASVTTAHVMIADEQLDAVEGYKEFIHHEQEETE